MKPVDPEVLAHMSRVEHGEGLDFGLVEKVNNDDDETAVLHLTLDAIDSEALTPKGSQRDPGRH